jgi:ferredoxin-NADP reductase
VTVTLPVTLRLDRKVPLADGVAGLTLTPDGPGPLPCWAPGAHIDLHLPGGLIRPYSLCGDPGDHRSWRVAVLREPDGRGGSAAVHDKLAEGDALTASAPRNHFPLQDAGRYLFIAGGIGITPLLPMIAAAERRGRPWRLVYGGRTRGSMAFLGELARHGDLVSVRPQDTDGLLDLDEILSAPAPGTAVYCCGPAPLLAAVEERCAGAWPAGALRTERFAPRADAAGGDAVGGEVEDTTGDGFEVEVASSGEVIAVRPGESVLACLRKAGHEILSSCEEGTCGTCETGVLAGVPEHRDTVLTEAERAAGDVMMICVSRAQTPRLRLDL